MSGWYAEILDTVNESGSPGDELNLELQQSGADAENSSHLKDREGATVVSEKDGLEVDDAPRSNGNASPEEHRNDVSTASSVEGAAAEEAPLGPGGASGEEGGAPGEGDFSMLTALSKWAELGVPAGTLLCVVQSTD